MNDKIIEKFKKFLDEKSETEKDKLFQYLEGKKWHKFKDGVSTVIDEFKNKLTFGLREKYLKTREKYEEKMYNYIYLHFLNSIKSDTRYSKKKIDEIEKLILSLIEEKTISKDDFISQYKQKILEEFGEFKLIGLDKPQSMDEYYIELKIYEDIKDREKLNKIILDKYSGLDSHEKELKPKKISVDDALKKFHNLYIGGEAGSGKTTLSKYITYKYIKENKGIPFFLPLGYISAKMKEKDLVDISDFIRIYVVKKIGISVSKDTINKIFDENNCILICDGLDEVPNDLYQRDDIISAIQNAPRKIKKIVTARTYLIKPLQNFDNALIAELEKKDMKKFLEKIIKNDTDKLYSQIENNEKILSLAKNPLLLSIIILIWKNEKKELPKSRVNLYKTAIEFLLEQLLHKRSGDSFECDYKDKLEIFQKIAFLFHSNGKRFLSKFELQKLTKKCLIKLDLFEKNRYNATKFLKNVGEKSNLLVKVGDNYSFIHLSFQEYLTALEIKENEEYGINEIINHVHDFWWEEVILLFAGKIKVATNLIKEIDKRVKEDFFYSNLILYGKCIADAEFTDVELKKEIIDKLWDLYLNSDFKNLRIKAEKTLILIKSEDVINKFLEALKDKDSDVRWRAAEALGKIGSEKAIEPLTKSLKDEDISVGSRAAEALGEIGSKLAVEHLIEALKDKNLDVRDKAAEALGNIGSELAVKPLIKALKDEDANVLLRAAEALGIIRSEFAVGPLIKALKDRDPFMRERVAYALGDIGSELAVKPLIKSLKDKGSDVRESVAWALGKIGSEQAVKPLVEALKDKDSDLRWDVIEAVGKIKSELAIKLLMETLKDKDNSVRKDTVEILGKIKNELAVESLVKALKDEDCYVRLESIKALENIGSDIVVQPLCNTIKDRDERVRWTAAKALGNIGSELAVESLIETLKDEDSWVRYNSAKALGKIGGETAVEPLIEALKDEHIDTRGNAAEALGKIECEAAVEPLIEALRGEDHDVNFRSNALITIENIWFKPEAKPLFKVLAFIDLQSNAARALGKIGSRYAVKPLIKALKYKDSNIRGNSIESLGRIGNNIAIKYLIDDLKNESEYLSGNHIRKVKDSAFEALEKISKKTGKRIYADEIK